MVRLENWNMHKTIKGLSQIFSNGNIARSKGFGNTLYLQIDIVLICKKK